MPDNRIPLVCERCGIPYHVKPNHQANRRYCSRQCWAAGPRPHLVTGLERRLWRQVNKTETCWLWTGGTVGMGYGRIRVEGRLELAHRIAWEITHGPIPDDLCVLHRCDVPACVNPDHLWLGTKAENNRDADEKGRRQRPRGAANAATVLTEAQVLEIRARVAAGEKQNAVARDYGVKNSTINAIVKRVNWRHVD